jgi:hypothetical protein
MNENIIPSLPPLGSLTQTGPAVPLDTGEPTGEDLENVFDGTPVTTARTARATPAKPAASLRKNPEELETIVLAAPRRIPAKIPAKATAKAPAEVKSLLPSQAVPSQTPDPGAKALAPAGPRVSILLPWYKSTNPLTATSVAALLKRADTGWSVDFGDAFVAHSRNKLADKFLAGKSDWCLWIDDDSVVPFGDEAWINHYCGFVRKIPGTNIIDKLLQSNKTLIGALYRGRYPGGDFMFAEARQSKKLGQEIFEGKQKGIRPTDWVGTGCMLVHRQVFLDIESKFPHLARKPDGTGGQWFSSSEHDLVNGVERVIKVLDDPSASESAKIQEVKRILSLSKQASDNNSKLGTGEDVILCHRARQSGHQPFVDLDAVIGHCGSHIYGFDSTFRSK